MGWAQTLVSIALPIATIIGGILLYRTERRKSAVVDRGVDNTAVQNIIDQLQEERTERTAETQELRAAYHKLVNYVWDLRMHIAQEKPPPPPPLPEGLRI